MKLKKLTKANKRRNKSDKAVKLRAEERKNVEEKIYG
jgi:hypothetical protein